MEAAKAVAEAIRAALAVAPPSARAQGPPPSPLSPAPAPAASPAALRDALVETLRAFGWAVVSADALQQHLGVDALALAQAAGPAARAPSSARALRGRRGAAGADRPRDAGIAPASSLRLSSSLRSAPDLALFPSGEGSGWGGSLGAGDASASPGAFAYPSLPFGRPRSLATLRDELIIAEEALPWSCVRRAWRQRRAAWRRALRASSSGKGIARAMGDLRGALLPDALRAAGVCGPPWIAAVETIAAGTDDRVGSGGGSAELVPSPREGSFASVLGSERSARHDTSATEVKTEHKLPAGDADPVGDVERRGLVGSDPVALPLGRGTIAVASPDAGRAAVVASPDANGAVGAAYLDTNGPGGATSPSAGGARGAVSPSAGGATGQLVGDASAQERHALRRASPDCGSISPGAREAAEGSHLTDAPPSPNAAQDAPAGAQTPSVGASLGPTAPKAPASVEVRALPSASPGMPAQALVRPPSPDEHLLARLEVLWRELASAFPGAPPSAAPGSLATAEAAPRDAKRRRIALCALRQLCLRSGVGRAARAVALPSRGTDGAPLSPSQVDERALLRAPLEAMLGGDPLALAELFAAIAEERAILEAALDADHSEGGDGGGRAERGGEQGSASCAGTPELWGAAPEPTAGETRRRRIETGVIVETRRESRAGGGNEGEEGATSAGRAGCRSVDGLAACRAVSATGSHGRSPSSSLPPTSPRPIPCTPSVLVRHASPFQSPTGSALVACEPSRGSSMGGAARCIGLEPSSSSSFALDPASEEGGDSEDTDLDDRYDIC